MNVLRSFLIAAIISLFATSMAYAEPLKLAILQIAPDVYIIEHDLPLECMWSPKDPLVECIWAQCPQPLRNSLARRSQSVSDRGMILVQVSPDMWTTFPIPTFCINAIGLETTCPTFEPLKEAPQCSIISRVPRPPAAYGSGQGTSIDPGIGSIRQPPPKKPVEKSLPLPRAKPRETTPTPPPSTFSPRWVAPTYPPDPVIQRKLSEPSREISPPAQRQPPRLPEQTDEFPLSDWM